MTCWSLSSFNYLSSVGSSRLGVRFDRSRDTQILVSSILSCASSFSLVGFHASPSLSPCWLCFRNNTLFLKSQDAKATWASFCLCQMTAQTKTKVFFLPPFSFPLSLFFLLHPPRGPVHYEVVCRSYSVSLGMFLTYKSHKKKDFLKWDVVPEKRTQTWKDNVICASSTTYILEVTRLWGLFPPSQISLDHWEEKSTTRGARGRNGKCARLYEKLDKRRLRSRLL